MENSQSSINKIKQLLAEKRWIRIAAICIGIAIIFVGTASALSAYGIIPPAPWDREKLAEKKYVCPDKLLFKDSGEAEFAILNDKKWALSQEEINWMSKNCDANVFTREESPVEKPIEPENVTNSNQNSTQSSSGTPAKKESVSQSTPSANQTTSESPNSQPSSQSSEGTVPQSTQPEPAPSIDNTPPVIKNLMVEFGRYDPATGRAGAFLFDANQDKVFLEFGARVMGPDGEKTLPTFEYRTAEGATVYAAADGYVTMVEYQADTADYEIIASPVKENSAWLVSYDHVKGVNLAVGDFISAGQTLGTVGSFGSGMGRTELMIRKHTESKDYCPFSLFSSSLIEEYKQKVRDLIVDWESFKGNTSIYDESRDIYPGCPYETLID